MVGAFKRWPFGIGSFPRLWTFLLGQTIQMHIFSLCCAESYFQDSVAKFLVCYVVCGLETSP